MPNGDRGAMSLPPRVPLTDIQLAALRRWVYVIGRQNLSEVQVERLESALDELADLRATRAELAHLRGVVRDAVELLRDEATFWHELYPAWLVHALLGEDAAITKQWNGVNNLNMARQRKAIRALVAAAGEDSDA